MTCTINASTSSSAIVSTADGSGVLKVQSNGVTTNALAWVNVSGVATPTINSSYNISSVTYTATGIYTVSFTNAMSSALYVPTYSLNPTNVAGNAAVGICPYNLTTTSFVFQTWNAYGVYASWPSVAIYIAIFGN